MVPRRKVIEVCAVCELDWDKHIKESQTRYRREWNAQFEDDDFKPPVDVMFATVELIDCIELLKRANQGPTGYTGPQGMAGMPGPSCPSCTIIGGPPAF